MFYKGASCVWATYYVLEDVKSLLTICFGRQKIVKTPHVWAFKLI
jgi:hypothetical protein